MTGGSGFALTRCRRVGGTLALAYARRHVAFPRRGAGGNEGLHQCCGCWYVQTHSTVMPVNVIVCVPIHTLAKAMSLHCGEQKANARR